MHPPHPSWCSMSPGSPPRSARAGPIASGATPPATSCSPTPGSRGTTRCCGRSGAGGRVRDEGSTNGTYVNGRRVTVEAVDAGTVLRFGHPEDGPGGVLSPPATAPPTGEPSPPTGEPSPPSGEPSPPTGEPSPPSGEPSPPTGEPSPPSGEPSPPPGSRRPRRGAGRRWRRAGRGAARVAARGHRRVPAAHVGAAAAGAAPCASAATRGTTWSSTTSWCRGATRSCGSGRTARTGSADLGSHSGTFLNGRRVGTARVTAGDVVGIGHCAYVLVGGRLVEYTDTGEALPRRAGPVRHRGRGP